MNVLGGYISVERSCLVHCNIYYLVPAYNIPYPLLHCFFNRIAYSDAGLRVRVGRIKPATVGTTILSQNTFSHITEHRREDALPQPGELTPENTSSDAGVSIGRRRLPTPPTSVHSRPIPRSMTLEELHAFRERIANTRLGHSISAMAKANSGRMRGALGMTRHTFNTLHESSADSVDRDDPSRPA